MPFREKSAWVMIAALTLAGIYYVYIVLTASLTLGHIAPPSGALVLAYLIALGIVIAFGEGIIAALSPKEANAPADERDDAIATRAGHVFGQVLAVGVVVMLGAYVMGPHGGTAVGGYALFHGVLAILMAAQITEYAAQIWRYRRGS